MISFASHTRVYLALQPCDMRRSYDGLYALVVESLHEDPLQGSVFVFTNRAHTRIKILHWDGTGLWIHAKRLEKGTFFWPRPSDASHGKIKMDATTLAMLTDGIDLKQGSYRAWYDRT